MRKTHLTRYYASYVFHLWFVHNKPFLMNSEKRQEIMLLFTPVRQRKIITSRSILTIPIGIRMNFARGCLLWQMALLGFAAPL